MKIYPYWFEKSITFDFNNKVITKKFFQGSNISQNDAEQLLNKNLPILIDDFKSHFGKKNKDRVKSFEEYDSDIVEPILEELSNDRTQAYITRNHYGTEVLCVDNMLILDLDFDSWYGRKKFKHSLINKLLSLVGIKTKQYLFNEAQKNIYNQKIEQIKSQFSFLKHEVNYIAEFLLNIEQFCSKLPSLNFRIYKTTRGLRAIETTRTWQAKSQEVKDIINEFHCDRVYYLFCLRQNCFRARLTPKPWRVKLNRLESSYPFKNDQNKKEYDAWVILYNFKQVNYSPYYYLTTIGANYILSQFKDIVLKHDSYIKCDKPLG